MAKPKKSSSDHEQLLQQVEMFKTIVEASPNDIQSMEILKEAYLNLDQGVEAAAVSKKIAQTYAASGQLSSAILEYEGILQKFPDDADCLAALGELESKMGGGGQEGQGAAAQAAQAALAAAENFEDGNEALLKFFQEQGLVKEKDAGNLLAAIHNAVSQTPSGQPAPSLLNLMSERGISSAEKSLELLVDKTRLPFLPLSIYEVDNGKATSVEKDLCLQHLVLPFDQISKTVMVATVNPFDARAKHKIEEQVTGKVQWFLAHPLDLIKQLKDIYRI